MKKTIYIPEGQEMRFENLTCDRLVVDGNLYVESNLMAKRISGKGFIIATDISAESIIANTINAGKIIADRLIAARIMAVEIHAVQSMAVSSYVEADYVKAGKVTLADAEISDLVADEVVKLSVKCRGLLGTLFASFIRAKWTSLTYQDQKNDVNSAAAETEPPAPDAEASENAGGYTSVEMTPDLEEAMELMSDPEFLRLKAMYKLTQETDNIWQLVPKKEPTNRAVILANQFTALDEEAA